LFQVGKTPLLPRTVTPTAMRLHRQLLHRVHAAAGSLQAGWAKWGRAPAGRARIANRNVQADLPARPL